MLPAGGTTMASLVQEELTRGGEHRTYLGALKIAEELWTNECGKSGCRSSGVAEWDTDSGAVDGD